MFGSTPKQNLGGGGGGISVEQPRSANDHELQDMA